MALSIHERTIASRDKVGVVSSSVSIGVTNDFYLAAVAVVATIDCALRNVDEVQRTAYEEKRKEIRLSG